MLENVNNIVSEAISARGRINCQTEFIRQGPATESKSQIDIRIKLFNEVELAQIAHIFNRRAPAHRNTRHGHRSIRISDGRELTAINICITPFQIQVLPFSR